MGNKKNICVLFSAFDFDRRFVFRGPEVPPAGPEGEKDGKKGEVKDKSDPRKALGELAASVEAKETEEKSYSIYNLDAIRRRLKDASNAWIKNEKDVIAFGSEIARDLQRASDALRKDRGDDLVIPQFRDRDSYPKTETRVWEELSVIGRTFNLFSPLSAAQSLRNAMIWIDPTTQGEQTVLLTLIRNRAKDLEKFIEEKETTNPVGYDDDIQNVRIMLAKLENRKREIQAMKLPAD